MPESAAKLLDLLGQPADQRAFTAVSVRAGARHGAAEARGRVPALPSRVTLAIPVMRVTHVSHFDGQRCLEVRSVRTNKGDIMTEKKTNVVVIGGGYAGVIAANHLRLNHEHRHHADQPAAAVRRADPAAPARHRIRRRRGRLRRRARRRASRLLVDTGRTHRRRRPHGRRWRPATPSATTTSSTPSAAPAPRRRFPAPPNSLIPSRELEHAEPLRAAVAGAAAGAPVRVVGAGPTGIETAAELAEEGHARDAGVRRRARART